MKKALLLFGISSLFLVDACRKPDTAPANTGTVYVDLPATPYKYETNGLFSPNFDELATLGRVLFYERRLSVNNSVACASCHRQEFAFADNVAFSRGFENRVTGRNSMPVQNLSAVPFGFSPAFFFWDGREMSLKNLIVRPITNHVEMGIADPAQLPGRISGLPYYANLFTDAFGDADITVDRISEAITAFSGSITANNTRFDRHVQTAQGLTALELQGLQLFNTKYNCNSCHDLNPGGYSTRAEFADIGLSSTYTDKGQGNITGSSGDMGKFRVPNLRNVALTAPYMHDGRFQTLDEVLEHYSHGINSSSNLDIRLRDATNQPMRMNISGQEKQAIIAFLRTLTDQEMITDPKFSNPFKYK